MALLPANTFRFGPSLQTPNKPRQQQNASLLQRASRTGERLLSALWLGARQQLDIVQQKRLAHNLQQNVKSQAKVKKESLFSRAQTALAFLALPFGALASAGALMMPVLDTQPHQVQQPLAARAALWEIMSAILPPGIGPSAVLWTDLAAAPLTDSPAPQAWDEWFDARDFRYQPYGSPIVLEEAAPEAAVEPSLDAHQPLDSSSFLTQSLAYDFNAPGVSFPLPSSVRPAPALAPFVWSVPAFPHQSSGFLSQNPSYNLRPQSQQQSFREGPLFQVRLKKSKPTGYQAAYVQNMQQAYPQALQQLRSVLTPQQYRRVQNIPYELVLAAGAYEWRWWLAENKFGITGADHQWYTENIAGFLKLIATERYYKDFQARLDNGEKSIPVLVNALRQGGYNTVNRAWAPTVVSLAQQFEVTPTGYQAQNISIASWKKS